MKTTLKGHLSRHPDGFGFLLLEDSEKDLYISKKEMMGCFTGDLVEVSISHFRGKKIVRIEKVISRKLKRLVVQAPKKTKDNFWIIDYKREWGQDLLCVNPKHLPIKEGDHVAVEIKSYPGESNTFKAQVVQSFGELSSDQDVVRSLFVNGVPEGFTQKAMQQAESCSLEELDLSQDRKDLSHLPFVTIDGSTAKDFDDAVYVQKEKDCYLLYVAIADVSHYVRPGLDLDNEAYAKGNSTYLGNHCEPMLPYCLSDGLCSLVPSEKRLVLVSEMRISFSGELLSYEFYQGVIFSHQRLTYGAVQNFLDDTRNSKEIGGEKVAFSIQLAAELAQKLMDRRFRQGAISFERSEVELVLSPDGEVVDIMAGQRLFAHQLIEELMLIANQAAALFLKSHDCPSLFRVHDEPDLKKITFWEEALHNLGLLQVGQSDKKQDITRKIKTIQEKVKGTEKESFITYLTLRTMQQAAYSPYNIGHFGLAFKNYTHFTSPIRRYSDLIVHRLIKSCLKIKSYNSLEISELESAGTWLSACERRSITAERMFMAIKKARFMHPFIGKNFEGYISGFSKNGLFVTLFNYPVDGFLPVKDLGFDEFELNALSMRGLHSGYEYHMGDPISVRLVAADFQKGFLDFTYDDK